jgi:membrane protein DedA with SNARE-associated domain
MDINDTQPLSLRDTAKGIAIRAGVLSIAGVVVGAWLFSLAAKAASGIVKIAAGTILLGAGAGIASWEVKKAQRRFAHRHQETPALT